MLWVSKFLVTPPKRYAPMDSPQRYRLVNPATLRTLMARTGTGSSISNRELAAAVGVSHGTIDALVNGHTRTQPHPTALAIAQVIGVDLLILWAPTGRAIPADDTTGDIAPHLAVSA